MQASISFNRPTLAGREFDYISEALKRGHLSGNGYFTNLCQDMIREQLGGGRVLLTHSGTAALEMSAILAGIEAGDEVIMPSFTFCSTANAIVLRGATPVFVDIRADTLNIDETLIEAAITPKTRAIVVVHYAGVGAEMGPILEIAERHGLVVIEDAAQAMNAKWNGTQLGRFGAFSAFSFHETKNLISGEGGALVVNDEAAAERAEIIWEKGTNRAQFKRGEVDKYTWMDLGSSFLPSDITAAFLLAQLEDAEHITGVRLAAWRRYHDALEPLERQFGLRRPVVPQHCEANGHIYYLLAPTAEASDRILDGMRARAIGAVTHYVPLHSAPAGLRYGRFDAPLTVTDEVASRLIRLPLHTLIDPNAQDRVVRELENILK